MKRIVLLISALFTVNIAFPQVGIGNRTPRATLDITGNAATTTVVDGIIAPRLTGSQLRLKNAVYLEPQVGTIVYVTAADTSPAGKTINVISEGYYFLNSALVWQKLHSGIGEGNFYVQDGSLTGNREVSMPNRTLAFTPTGTQVVNQFSVDGTTFSVDALNNSVGIGTNTPNTAAILDVNSTNKGFLPPRMTNAEMKAIVNPVNGLVVYNTTLNCLAYYVNGSYNCSHNAPSLTASSAPSGSTFTSHFNGIISGVNIDPALATYTSGETFNQNTTCIDKEISSKGCGGLTQVVGASGTVYPLVNINGQCWFQTNLKEIPSNFATYSTTSWLNTAPGGDQGYWGYYNTVTTNGSAGWGISEPGINRGLLYQWSAAMDNSLIERSRGICPVGFHIPSDCEWKYLEHGLGMSIAEQNATGLRANADPNLGSVGYKLRAEGTGWTNASNFSALPSGHRLINTGGFNGFTSLYMYWSSTIGSTSTQAFNRYLSHTNALGVTRQSNPTHNAYSVRCLKD